jgi:TonB family protein
VVVHVFLVVALLMLRPPAPRERKREVLREISYIQERYGEKVAARVRPKSGPKPASKESETAKPSAPPAHKAKQAPLSPAVAAPPAVPQGQVGRQRARREVTEQVASVTGSLQSVLKDLSSSLSSVQPALVSASPAAGGGRRRMVGVGRSAEQLASVGGAAPAGASATAGPSLQSSLISIEAITGLTASGWSGGAGGDGGPSGSGTGGGAVGGAGSGVGGVVGGTGTGGAGARAPGRSNASLLAVVRRYAPGIQFCYDNELKRNPSLRGKIVVSLVVAASGEVLEAAIVADSLGAPAMRECVLAQLRAWKFPAIPEGTVAFNTPFVFTPSK